MKLWLSLFVIGALIIVAVGRKDSSVGAASAPPPSMGFFVTSAKSKTGNLGGLVGRGPHLSNLGRRCRAGR